MAPRFAAPCLALSLLLSASASRAAEPVRVLDLRPLFGAAPSSIEERRQAYDTLVAATCLQGIVNRAGPNLYLHYVKSVVDGSIDTDQLWFDRLADPTVGAGVVAGRQIVNLGDLDEALQAYAPFVKGLVVWDEHVPATVNAAFTAAGAEDLIAVRWDASAGSLYQTLKAKWPVVVSLVNDDGSSRFLDDQGSAMVPDTGRQTSQSAKADAYVWALEKYLKPGKLDPTEFGWMIDAHWILDPNDYKGNANATHQLQITNRDWLVAKRGLPFDLSPWSDVAATDDPGQPVGTDPGILKELMASARQGAGNDAITIRGFFAWQFKYTSLQGLPAGHEPVQGEWSGVRLVSPWAVGLDADAPGVATMANASFFSHVPLIETPEPQKRPTAEDLIGAGFLKGLASNGSFEDGEDGWVMHVTNHVVHADSKAGEPASKTGLRRLQCNTSAVGNDSQDNLYRDGAAVSPGTRVTLRAFVRAPAAPVQGELVIWAMGGETEQSVTKFTAGTSWSEVRVALDVAKAGHTSTRGQLYLRTANANLDVDDVAFYAGDAAAAAIEPANYMLWFVGDYDGTAWMYEFSPVTWDRPGRGLVPFAWDFAGHNATRFPPFFRHVLATRTPRDFFIGADSGPGYGNPGVMDAASRAIWAKGGVNAARRLDASASWILNPLDPLDEQHMDAVTPFTGDGILLMSGGGVQPPTIVDHAPVLQLHNLGGSGVDGISSWIVGATTVPSNASFTAMRAVLEPSTDLVGASHKVIDDHPSRRYRFVDPFAFFYLARKSLGGSNSYRASFREVALESPALVGKAPHLSLRVRNDGWETWTAGKHRLGLHVSSTPPVPRSLPSDSGGYPTRVSLPANVPPGGEVALDADLPAPASTGVWYVQADLVEEGVTWFETQGDIPMLLTLDVVDAPSDGGAGESGAAGAGGSAGGAGSSASDASIGGGGDSGGEAGAAASAGAAAAAGSAGKGTFDSSADDGGCGCAMPGRARGASGWLLILAAWRGLAFGRRRRTRK